MSLLLTDGNEKIIFKKSYETKKKTKTKEQ
jgi:hypothetical protein